MVIVSIGVLCVVMLALVGYYAWVKVGTDMIEDKHPPMAELSAECDETTGGYNWTVRVIEVTGQKISVEDIQYFVLDPNSVHVCHGKICGNVSYNDLDNNNILSENDTFYVLGSPYGLAKTGYIFGLIYNKSGDRISEITLP